MSAGKTAHPQPRRQHARRIHDRTERYLAIAGAVVKLGARLFTLALSHSGVATRRRISIPALLLVPASRLEPSSSQGYFAMQNGRKTPRHFKPGPPPISRPKRWTPNADRAKPNGSGNAQRTYERYLALAQEESRSGNIVAAENYYTPTH
jgi:hypothetical protein